MDFKCYDNDNGFQLLLKDLKESTANGSTFINSIFSDVKEIQLTSFSIIAKCLTNANNENDKNLLIDTIWKKIDLNLLTAPYLIAICFLLDYFVDHTVTREQLEENEIFHSTLQRIFLSNDEADRKYVFYILRKIFTSCMNVTNTQDWLNFFLLIDTVKENHSHLIEPVLTLIPKTNELPVSWRYCLFASILQINNSINQIVGIVLREQNLTKYHPCYAYSILTVRLYEAINSTTLFQDKIDKVVPTDSLQTFIRCHLEYEFVQETILKIMWKPVPFYSLCTAIAKCENLPASNSSFIFKLMEASAKVPNYWLRNAALLELRNIFFNMHSTNKGAFSRFQCVTDAFIISPVYSDTYKSAEFSANTVVKILSRTNMDVSKEYEISENIILSIVNSFLKRTKLCFKKFIKCNYNSKNIEQKICRAYQQFLAVCDDERQLQEEFAILSQSINKKELDKFEVTVLQNSAYYKLRAEIIENVVLLEIFRDLDADQYYSKLDELIHFEIAFAMDIYKVFFFFINLQ